MSILANKVFHEAKIMDLEFSPDEFKVILDDGRKLTVPIEWFPRLRDATESDIKEWRLIGGGIGIHWEKLDEDISLHGLLSN